MSTQSAETSMAGATSAFGRPSESGLCGLDGCEEPLPPRPLDELGRPKGGRRARYCSKAHADAASRQRRASDLAAVSDPLALAREATAGVIPAAKQLSEQLTSLVARFEQAENGALARVRAAETEAEQAHAEATRAAEAEQQAEQARREALAAARRDREEKEQALRRAELAQAEVQQVRDDAWKQIAEHERARGQAEAELATLRASLEALRREHAALLDTSQDQRTRITGLDLQLATTGVELRQAQDRVADLTDRLQQLGNTLEQLESSRQQNEQRHQEALAQHEARSRDRAEGDAKRYEAEIARLRARLETTANQSNGKPGGAAPVGRATKAGRRRPRVAGNRPTDRTRPQT